MGRPKGKNGGAQDYTIGYGRPPAHSRFKPGQSGNPKGRPRGARNLAILLQQELNRPITVREGDQYHKVSKLEAMIKLVVEKALKGDLRAFATIRDMVATFSAPGSTPLSEADRKLDEAILEDFLARYMAEVAPADPAVPPTAPEDVEE